MKLKHLSDEHYIVVNESELGENVLVYNFYHNRIEKFSAGARSGLCWPITHSTKPLDCACSNRGSRVSWTWADCAERNRCFDKVQYLPLQEVKELLGEVDKAFERYPIIENDKDHNDRNYYRRSAYYQALEDNKEKKWTDEDVIKIVEKNRQTGLTAEYIILSLQPKTEWEVEFIDGKLRLKQ